MASIANDPNGRRRIQFVDSQGNRRTIRLGKCPQKIADTIKSRIEAIIAAKSAKTAIDRETAEWLGSIDRKMHAKLVRAGLTEQRLDDTDSKVALLEAFIDDYVAKRKAKPASKEIWRQGKLGLVEFFGAERPMREVTPGHADDYREWLLSKPIKSRAKTEAKADPAKPAKTLAPMTVRKRLQFAKMVFRAAARHKLIDADPFADVGIKAAMPDRMSFISCDDTAKLLLACPGQDWRTIVALARWGGLRCPSEVLSLKWTDIDWKEARITVTAPKTEHHPGKGTRVMPLFPELRGELQAAFEAAPDGAVYVVDERFRKGSMGPSGWRNCNLRTTFEKIIRRAGLTPWPRLFHNLRSSRQTELCESFPSHVVCAWLGNSPDIAAEHYLQVTTEHFDRATGEKKAAQKAAQYPAVTTGSAQDSKTETSDFPKNTKPYDSAQKEKRMGRDSNPRCLRTPVFKTGALNHSATHPIIVALYS
jgi:integrase